MIPKTRLVAVLVLFLAAAMFAGPDTTSEFSTDRAMEHLRMLAGTIGPRPMGSPAERKAMEYALGRLKAFGCQDTFIMPFTFAAGVNTRSGIAVGVLKGETGRIIVIGGHIDSEGPEVPGANDNGSGAACVLELARILAQKPRHSTFLFCLWGGEEMGLCGSQYFAGNFALIDSVKLMLQIDMADGEGPVEADPDGPFQVSAPRWLVEASFDIFYNDLHYSGLRYPTQFATLNSTGSGSSGSDHIPFIQRGIPAIDFTTDITYPIHSPLDNLGNFTPSGLKRSGDLVLRLAERFDRGQPAGSTEQYWLVQAGNLPLYIPHWAIRAFAVLSISGSLWLLFVLFRGERHQRLPKIRLSGLKLLGVTLFVSVFIWMSPSLVGIVEGYRYPWAARFPAFVVLGIVAGVLGTFMGIRWLMRVKISRRTAPMFLRAVVVPVAVTALLAARDVELAVYPAALLVLWTLAVWVRSPWAGLCALLASAVIGYKVVFFDGLGLFQHLITTFVPDTLVQALLYHGAYILLFGLLLLPYTFAAAAWYRHAGRDLLKIRMLSGPRGLAAAGGCLVLAVTLLSLGTPYDAKWEPIVRVRQAWNSLDTSGAVRISSSEKFREMRVRWEGRDTLLAGSATALPSSHLDPDAWCAVSVHDSIIGMSDSLVTLERTLLLRAPVSPLAVTVSFESSRRFEAVSPWIMGVRGPSSGGGLTDKRKVFSWYAFPDTLLRVPVTLIMKKNQRISQSATMTFDTLATPVWFEKPPPYRTTRFTVTRQDSLTISGIATAAM